MALPTSYSNGSITFDIAVYDDVGNPMELDLSKSFVTLYDGAAAVRATIAGGGTAAGISLVAAGNYIVQNWPLGGTVGTGNLQARWYGVGTDAGTIYPQPYVEDIYLIVSAPSRGYCVLTDLPKYGLEGATNYYADDTEGNGYIEQAWNWANRRLEALVPDVTIPLGTNSAGVYDEHAIALNALMTNYYLASRRHRGEFTQMPQWISDFRDDAFSILDAIGSRNVVFEEQTSAVESGIGAPSAGATNTSAATFHTDRFGYESPYLASDMERSFFIKIDSAGSPYDVTNCSFKWSTDNGASFQMTGVQCSTSWIGLDWGVHIRWERVGGTTNQLVLNDCWRFACVPLSKPIAGAPHAARSIRGLRS